eukprot:s662_g4.t1
MDTRTAYATGRRRARRASVKKKDGTPVVCQLDADRRGALGRRLLMDQRRLMLTGSSRLRRPESAPCISELVNKQQVRLKTAPTGVRDLGPSHVCATWRVVGSRPSAFISAYFVHSATWKMLRIAVANLAN